MHGIVEVTSFYSEYFRSRAHVGVKLLTISQPTRRDNQPRSLLHIWPFTCKQLFPASKPGRATLDRYFRKNPDARRCCNR